MDKETIKNDMFNFVPALSQLMAWYSLCAGLSACTVLTKFMCTFQHVELSFDRQLSNTVMSQKNRAIFLPNTHKV